MLVSAFDTFVRGSDQSVGKPEETRRDIATYGLAGEIGSVISAIKNASWPRAARAVERCE